MCATVFKLLCTSLIKGMGHCDAKDIMLLMQCAAGAHIFHLIVTWRQTEVTENCEK